MSDERLSRIRNGLLQLKKDVQECDLWNEHAGFQIKAKIQRILDMIPMPDEAGSQEGDVSYAIGIEFPDGASQFTHGPSPDWQDMLSVVPDSPFFKIYQFQNGQKKPMFFWNDLDEKWQIQQY